jgi:hypothetical protein
VEKAKNEYRRQAPLEEGRNGLMQVHFVFYSSAKWVLKKWIDDPNAVDFLTVLHLFCEQNVAPSLPGHAQDQSIPVRKTVQTVHIDRCENVVDGWLGDTESRKDLDFVASNSRIQFQLLRDRNNILV